MGERDGGEGRREEWERKCMNEHWEGKGRTLKRLEGREAWLPPTLPWLLMDLHHLQASISWYWANQPFSGVLPIISGAEEWLPQWDRNMKHRHTHYLSSSALLTQEQNYRHSLLITEHPGSHGLELLNFITSHHFLPYKWKIYLLIYDLHLKTDICWLGW